MVVVYIVLHPNTHGTFWDKVIHCMAINVEIHGVKYFSSSEIMKEIGVSRQTLWRWRQEGKIPLGHRFRDGRILFTSDEIESIRQFANRIDTIDLTSSNQLSLFNQKL